MTEPTETTRATRRRFLIGAAGLAATGMPAARAENAKNLPPNVAGWTRQLGEGVGVRAYGNPSKYEKDVIRRTVSWLTATPESSVSFTPLHQLDGIITPNGLCFERHHGGIAEIDPSDYRLMLHGMVDKSLIFTLDELKRLPRVNKIYFLECAANSGMEWRGAQLNGCQYTHGMVHCVQYTGVSLKVLLEQAGLKPNAKWVMAEGGDAAAMNRSIPIEKALDDCIVAYRMNGEMLRPEQGYPVRLVVPGWEGNIWIKWLRRLKVGDQPWFTREETSKYTDSARKRQGTPIYLRDGRKIGDHLTVAASAGETERFQRHFGLWLGPGAARSSELISRLMVAATGAPRASTARCSTRPACASITSSTGTAKNSCSSRAQSTTPATCSRARTPCAKSAASTQSTTTTASRPGPSSRTGRSRMSRWASLAFFVALLFAFNASARAQTKNDTPRNYGIGRVATPEQIAGWDIDIRPDGQGAPSGRGSVKDGEKVYMDKCAACHGEFGESAGRWPQLAQGKGTLASHDPVKTVGSYFPYLSSVFDYIRRAMPFGDSESLTNDELYAVTAYVLNLNDIVDDKFVLVEGDLGQGEDAEPGRFFRR